MSKFDSAAFSSSTSSVSKMLKPGTHYCKIADVQMNVPSFNPNAMTITFVMVGPDLPDFEGMAVDKMNPSLGNYKGQAAYVRAGKYPFSDYTPPKGPKIERDQAIGRYLTGLASSLGIDMKDDSNRIIATTIEEFIYKMKEKLVNAGYFYVTIAGSEKTTEYGKNYQMYLPKNEKNSAGKYISPFFKDEAGLKDSDLKDKMVLFDENKHIDKEVVVSATSEAMSSGSILGGFSTTGSVKIASSTTTTLTAVPDSKSPFDF
jgi:hypothetical protein